MNRPAKTSKFYIISGSDNSQSRNISKPIVQNRQFLPRYEIVSSFKNMKELSSLSMQSRQLIDFLQSRRSNFLFIFGPSGCGKTLLVETILKRSGIPFEYGASNIGENENEDVTYQDLFSIMDEILHCRNKCEEKVILLNEFPIDIQEAGPDYHFKYLSFKESIYDSMSRCDNRNKHIFILNSEIYNPFYLLSQNSESKALTKLPSVQVIKMQPYGNRDMKEIIRHFIMINPAFCLNNEEDEIIAEAAGDARKALNLIYQKKMMSIAKKEQQYLTITRKEQQYHFEENSSNSSFSSMLGCSLKTREVEQEQAKVTVFHMLGKFLYAKRYNIFYNPRAKTKKERGPISRAYTQEELRKYNPKFYFKPVQLFQKSHMTLPVFVDLLQQNYINRFSSIKDLATMSKLFCYYDSYLSDTINWVEIREHMKQNMKILITWGIIVYNRNPISSGTMYRIQRSKQKVIDSLKLKKLEVIKSHYLRTGEGGKYRLKDIVQFAWRTKNVSKYSNVLHQKLIEVVLDQKKRNIEIDSYQNVINEDEEDLTKDSCNRVNQLNQIIQNQLNRRKDRMSKLLAEDSDESDIDEEEYYG